MLRAGAMLEDPPILTLRRDFQHPDRSLIARLAGAQTGHIVDALKGAARSTITTGRSILVNELPARACACGGNDDLPCMVGAADGRRVRRCDWSRTPSPR